MNTFLHSFSIAHDYHKRKNEFEFLVDFVEFDWFDPTIKKTVKIRIRKEGDDKTVTKIVDNFAEATAKVTEMFKDVNVGNITVIETR